MVLFNIVLNDFTSDSRVLKTARAGIKCGFNTYVIALHKEGLKRVARDESGFKLIRIRLRVRKTFLKYLPIRIIHIVEYLEFLFRVRSLGKRLKPNLVHANDFELLPVGCFMKFAFATKLVYDSHELASFENRSDMFSKIGITLERLLVKQADLVMTVTPSFIDVMKRNFKIEEVHVIRNLPKISRFKNFNGEKKLRKFLGINKETRVILYHGAVLPNRGLNLLVEAASRINYPNFIIVIMGNGISVDGLKEQVESTNLSHLVKFLPAVPYDDLPAWTNDADIGANPAIGNSQNSQLALPTKNFEFIGAGIPTISSSLKGMVEIVEKYKVGLIFKDGSVTDLVEKTEILLKDEALTKTLIDNCEIASQELDWDVEEEKLIGLYNSVVNK